MQVCFALLKSAHVLLDDLHRTSRVVVSPFVIGTKDLLGRRLTGKKSVNSAHCFKAA